MNGKTTAARRKRSADAAIQANADARAGSRRADSVGVAAKDGAAKDGAADMLDAAAGVVGGVAIADAAVHGVGGSDDE